MIFIAFVSIYLTIKSRFFQIRSFRFIFNQTLQKMFSKNNSTTARSISPFQATSTSLAGTVGMGNMAGVATAISIGGPGAIFWMWMMAFFGMITKAAEITLAVHYREIDAQGNIQGGPMYYIRKALGWRMLAILFSIGIAWLKDIPDIKGDRNHGIETLAVNRGSRWVFRGAISLVSFSYLTLVLWGFIGLPGFNKVFLSSFHFVVWVLFLLGSLKANPFMKKDVKVFYRFYWVLFFVEYLFYPLGLVL